MTPRARVHGHCPCQDVGARAGVCDPDTYLGDRYRRLVRRRGKKRAIAAVGNTLLTIIWHLPDAHYVDLGAVCYASKINKGRARDLIRQLEHLTGHSVTLNPAG